jgi:hypothetical protein
MLNLPDVDPTIAILSSGMAYRHGDNRLINAALFKERIG